MVEVLTLDIKWHDEDNCYVCKIKEYPGLSAHEEDKYDEDEMKIMNIIDYKNPVM